MADAIFDGCNIMKKASGKSIFFRSISAAKAFLGLAFSVVLFGSYNYFQAVWHKLFKSKTPNNACSRTVCHVPFKGIFFARKHCSVSVVGSRVNPPLKPAVGRLTFDLFL